MKYLIIALLMFAFIGCSQEENKVIIPEQGKVYILKYDSYIVITGSPCDGIIEYAYFYPDGILNDGKAELGSSREYESREEFNRKFILVPSVVDLNK